MGVGRHRHQRTIFGALKEADVSVRRRAADLLFAMATADNAVAIVEELLTFLVIADASMRAEMVLKTAILAEMCDTPSLTSLYPPASCSVVKMCYCFTCYPFTCLHAAVGATYELPFFKIVFSLSTWQRVLSKNFAIFVLALCFICYCFIVAAPVAVHLSAAIGAYCNEWCKRRFFPDLQWYVNTMVTLIERSGEYATEDVWLSTVQLVRHNLPCPLTYVSSEPKSHKQNLNVLNDGARLWAGWLLGTVCRQIELLRRQSTYDVWCVFPPCVNCPRKSVDM